MATLEERVAALEAKLEGLLEAAKPVDLSSQYANFKVRKSPPNWLEHGGNDYAGYPIAETTPEFCEALASYLDWQAGKDEAKNYSYVNAKGTTVFPAKYARIDAARARAWAQRMRAQAPGIAKTGTDGELPF